MVNTLKTNTVPGAVLTDEQIQQTAQCLTAEVSVDGESLVLKNVNGCIRAIEQAVLQSPEVQRLRKLAARYNWLTQDAYITDCYTHEGIILEVAGTDRQVPIDGTVDAAIDAAMEKQP